jgi:hypothetical protein
MKRILHTLVAAVLLTSVIACSNEPSTTSADSLKPSNAVAAPVADKVEPAKVEPTPKVIVPAGTKLRVALLQAVSSDKSRSGEQFMTSLTEPVVIDGKTVLPKGTKIRGRVTNAVESGRVKGRASLQLTLTEIVRDAGNVSISTKAYTAVAESTKKRDAAVIGGGAGLGAAIGAIAGGGKGAAIGAAVGGGAGTGGVLATKGKEIRYGAEHLLSFTLSNSIEL